MPGAAAATVFATAHVALDLRAQLRQGERVLVTGAAGGVGYWLYDWNQEQLAQEEAALEAARRRARTQEAERLQRLKE